jgi:lysine 2,3-aminomutase
VHQQQDYDRERGISTWTKNYRTSIEVGEPEALTRTYPYYDPIDTLPQAGQAWWRENADIERLTALAQERAASSRAAAQAQAQAAAPTHTL